MKYVIAKYLRISAEDIDLDGLDKYESDSITNQRDLLGDFIASMPEFADCEIIEALDDGRTGTNFDRPGIHELLDLARCGGVNCIVVKDLSRFGRNYLEVGDYLEQIFPAWGVRFISINDMYDSARHGGSTGGIDIAFRNLIYELYSQDLSVKVRSGNLAAINRGQIVANDAFFGYTKDVDDRHRFVIDDKSAETVRLIFNFAEQGLSSNEIARKLNDGNIPTVRDRKLENGAKRDWGYGGKSYWLRSRVSAILRDERYTGKYICGKYPQREIAKKTTVCAPKSEWRVIPGAIPQIISEEQFKSVSEIVAANTKPGNRSSGSTRSLFYRQIRCGNCGRALRRVKSSKHYIYFCASHDFTDDLTCMSGSIRESVISDAVLVALQQQVKLADEARLLRKSKSSTMRTDSEALNVRIQSLQRAVHKAKSEKMSLWEQMHSGVISREAYGRESEKLTAQISGTENKISVLEAERRNAELSSGSENKFVERFIRQIGITELTREVVDEFIQRVNIYAPDRIEIIWSYADGYDEIVKLAGEEG